MPDPPEAKEEMPETFVYRGLNEVRPDEIGRLPRPPAWRQFSPSARSTRGSDYQASPPEIEMVNAALHLRRPLLVTGKPGSGKSSLAYAVAYELGLGEVLTWPITTRSTLQQGLYAYDAIGRLQDASLENPSWAQRFGAPRRIPDIGRYIRLGPLGTALLGGAPLPVTTGNNDRIRLRPRVLLIDEIDKSDIDLPNDLLNVFEEGQFEIPELSRLPQEAEYDQIEVATFSSADKVKIPRGIVRCEEFPLVILTSNGERDFPPAFLRRCLRLQVSPPTQDQLLTIIEKRIGRPDRYANDIETLLKKFVELRDKEKKELATDQLLNAVFMVVKDINPNQRESLRKALLQSLTENVQ